jgi:hypothetical protein
MVLIEDVSCKEYLVGGTARHAPCSLINNLEPLQSIELHGDSARASESQTCTEPLCALLRQHNQSWAKEILRCKRKSVIIYTVCVQTCWEEHKKHPTLSKFLGSLKSAQKHGRPCCLRERGNGKHSKGRQGLL